MVRMISEASCSDSACRHCRATAMSCSIAARASPNLLLGALPGLSYCRCTGLLCRLPAGFLRLKDSQAGFAQALLVLLGLGFGCGYIGACLEDGAFGAFAPLLQNPLQGLANQGGIERVQQQQQHRRRDCAEQ